MKRIIGRTVLVTIMVVPVLTTFALLIERHGWLRVLLGMLAFVALVSVVSVAGAWATTREP